MRLDAVASAIVVLLAAAVAGPGALQWVQRLRPLLVASSSPPSPPPPAAQPRLLLPYS